MQIFRRPWGELWRIIMQLALSIEQFIPKLDSGIKQLELKTGEVCLLFQNQNYYYLTEYEGHLYNSIDGTKTLTQIALATANSNTPISIPTIVQFVQALAHFGGLENPPIQLQNYGLITKSHDHLTLQLFSGLFNGTLSSQGLGKLVTQLFSLARSNLPAQLVLLGFSIVGFAACSFHLNKIDTWTLDIDGNFGIGFLALYCGAMGGLTARQFMRAWVLGSKNAPCHSFGFGLRYLVLTPLVDTRHITLGGRKAELELAIGGIVGLIIPVIGLAIVVIQGQPTFGLSIPSLSLALCGAALVLSFFLFPYGKTDLGWITTTLLYHKSGLSKSKTPLGQRYFQLLIQTHVSKSQARKGVFLLTSCIWFLTNIA